MSRGDFAFTDSSPTYRGRKLLGNYVKIPAFAFLYLLGHAERQGYIKPEESNF